ncbi:hypothetical protein [Streptomyces lonarensis]|uniref:Uncharacterized protein n=1 Tax=Streptomyces lonarensis TaxID=700599 RepID=A0A7X6HYZ4_9ACTN|nr:hypothetical protein [Streptomyces lonarensis]NJQ06118.1 hypothetical protein [Streptomyces lonarensis]
MADRDDRDGSEDRDGTDDRDERNDRDGTDDREDACGATEGSEPADRPLTEAEIEADDDTDFLWHIIAPIAAAAGLYLWHSLELPWYSNGYVTINHTALGLLALGVAAIAVRMIRRRQVRDYLDRNAGAPGATHEQPLRDRPAAEPEGNAAPSAEPGGAPDGETDPGEDGPGDDGPGSGTERPHRP